MVKKNSVLIPVFMTALVVLGWGGVDSCRHCLTIPSIFHTTSGDCQGPALNP